MLRVTQEVFASMPSDDRIANSLVFPTLLPQGDTCIMQRILSVAKDSKYRLVRTILPEYIVDIRSDADETSSCPWYQLAQCL
jgi:hypothetical protein